MRIAVVGAGGVGAQTLLELAKPRHHTTIIDRDIVDQDTLSRQTLYNRDDIGRLKADIAAEKLGPRFFAKAEHLDQDSASVLLAGANVVLDCTDNWQTRCVINQWALQTGTPWIFTSAIKHETMATTLTGKTACFVCWNPRRKTPRSCRAEGITRDATTLAAKTQAAELARLCAGKPALAGILQYTDTAQKTCARTALEKNPACPACVKKTFCLPKQKAAVLCGDGEYLFETGRRTDGRALASFRPKKFGDVLKVAWKKGELVVLAGGRILTRGLTQREATSAVDALLQKMEK